MNLIDHLEQQFYRSNQLCQLLQIDSETLSEWQHLRVFPQPSYELNNQVECHSYQGIYPCQVLWQYYPSGLVQWAKQIQKGKINNASVAFALFYQQAQNALMDLSSRQMCIDESYVEDLEQRLTYLWQQFLTGRYGTQTRTATVEEVVQLDAIRYQIDTLTEGLSITTLDAQTRKALHPLLKQLSKVLNHPLEHEYPQSLRRKYIDELVMRYDLSLAKASA